MPTNLYGPFDRFDESDSHVIPGLMLKMHKAKQTGADSVTLWGTGKALREFLHISDLADALILLLQKHSSEDPVNIGSGMEISIDDLAGLIRGVVGFDGKIVFDPARPDGTPRKILNSSTINALGWTAKIGLRDGLEETYRWFVDTRSSRSENLERTASG